MPYLEILSPGIPVNSLAAVTGTTANGTAYTLPAKSCDLSWQAVFATPPASIITGIQVSNDGTNFQTVDTTNTTTGSVRTITPAPFLQVRAIVVTGTTAPSGLTVILLAKVK